MATESHLEFECSKCRKSAISSDSLQCTDCQLWTHIKCLQYASTPGDLIGDVFFDFTCAKCVIKDAPGTSKEKTEKFVRQRLPWVIIITLTLYNLLMKSKGLGRQGYFHWRSHIVSFIDRNWQNLFEPSTKRRKNWIGSVSGNLSSNSPKFFRSGHDVFKESGWWKSSNSNATPSDIYAMYKDILKERQNQRHMKRTLVDESNVDEYDCGEAGNKVKKRRESFSLDLDVPCSRTIPYMGRMPKPIKIKEAQSSIDVHQQSEEEHNKSLNPVQSGLMDFLAANLAEDDLNMFSGLPIDVSLLNSDKERIITRSQLNDDDDLGDINSDDADLVSEEDHQTEKHKPRIVQINHFQEIVKKNENCIKAENGMSDNVEKVNSNIEVSSDNENTDNTFEVSNLSINRLLRKLPWLKADNEKKSSDIDSHHQNNSRSLRLMNLSEEKELLKELHKVFSELNRNPQGQEEEIPFYIRRFYRKLVVRQWKRDRCKPIFNVHQSHASNAQTSSWNEISDIHSNIIDRYHLLAASGAERSTINSFHTRIAGSSQYELFQSPFTHRILRPFIYRNTKIFPTWVKLMCELKHRVNPECIPNRASIDFCYVRPYHIAAVNALLQTEFWPGIDMSECLGYPDYSVVAQYKKLIVGCGFLVPDVGYNEAYISFMAVRPGWKRHGIGTFMLYHLIQTCMTKDITLHVSATNPAVVLYQKFGFKTEEIILDFYDKYLPMDSSHSHHALFLRLIR